jgi:hypothetical protein
MLALLDAKATHTEQSLKDHNISQPAQQCQFDFELSVLSGRTAS